MVSGLSRMARSSKSGFGISAPAAVSLDEPRTEKPDGNTVYDRLRSDILSCRLPPGVQIYEQDLGRRLGVSKSPVRDALVRLKDQNLVEVKPRSGYRVRPISVSEVKELYDIRVMYETACIERTVDNRDEATLQALERLAGITGVKSATGWVLVNDQFHEALAQSCGNRRLATITSEFISQFARFTHISVSRMVGPQSFDDLAADHMAIAACIKSRDKRGAVKLIRQHIEASRKRTMDAITTPMFVS